MDTTQKLSLLHGSSPLSQSALSNSFISSLREVVVELLVYVVRSCSHRPAGEEPGFHSQETANLPVSLEEQFAGNLQGAFPSGLL